MNPRLGKFLALFFAACFLALQFHPVGDTQLEHNVKRIFHIEEVSTSVIALSMAKFFNQNMLIYPNKTPKLSSSANFLGE